MQLEPGDVPPKSGDFILTIGKRRTINSVYLVKTSRSIKRRDPEAAPRQALKCYRSCREEAVLGRRGSDALSLNLEPEDKEVNDKEVRITKRRVHKLLDEWATGAKPRIVPLKGWILEITYSLAVTNTATGEQAAADCTANWAYKRAEMTFYLPALQEMADLDVELVIVHELCHALVNEMREWGTHFNNTDPELPARRHEERVVTELALGFLGTKYRDAKIPAKSPKREIPAPNDKPTA